MIHGSRNWGSEYRKSRGTSVRESDPELCQVLAVALVAVVVEVVVVVVMADVVVAVVAVGGGGGSGGGGGGGTDCESKQWWRQ